MLGPRLARPLVRSAVRALPWRSPYSTASKISDPLRVLFCGSDQFSCASLQALHDEHKRNADLIRSIDVVVRPGKPTGRGYKVMRDVPLRTLAEQLGLPVHVRDTFTGWDMPTPNGDPINLIIAVSFGLFVPPRLIRASKYGGLNVHPSLLPDLRGPAPIHHALLAERAYTGVSIQTLSPHAFDEGAILLQTPPPGTPIPPDCTLQQLHDLLAPAGASMLVEAVRSGLHVPPYPPQSQSQSQSATAQIFGLRHAPKITSDDRQVRWTSARAGNAQAVALQARVLGPLWTHIRRRGNGTAEEKRAILEHVSVTPSPSESAGSDGGQLDEGSVIWLQKPSGREGDGAREDIEVEVRYLADADGEAALVQMSDGSWLRVGKIKLEGSTLKPARRVLESMRSR